MGRKVIRCWLLSGLVLVCTQVIAQEAEGKDTLVQVFDILSADTSLSVGQPAKRSFFKKFLDYFNDANKEKKNKKFDFSVIGGPHYSSDTRPGFIVPTGPIRYFLSLRFLCMRMYRLLDSICWGCGVAIYFLTNAYRRAYLRIDQRFSPAFLGNKYAFSSTEVTTNYYHPVWKGGVLAGQFHTLLNYGDPPWGLMATLGSSYSMRGYYEGRYRDKNAMDVQLELRQHVWKRQSISCPTMVLAIDGNLKRE